MLVAEEKPSDRFAAMPEMRLLARFFSVAVGQAREMGIKLRLRSDFEALSRVNARNRDSWIPLLPSFDPAYSDLEPEAAIWFEALDGRGDTIAACATRAYHWPRTTFAEEARSLRMFYRDPEPHVAAGETIDLPDSPATKITGDSACIGALWVTPTYRGAGLTKIIPKLCKAYAHMHWHTSTCWSFFNPVHFAGDAIARALGSINVDWGVHLRLERHEVPAVITHQSRAAFLMDAARAVSRRAIESSRRIETTLTKESSPERHGSASL
jgi:hypothetical protein